MDWAKTWNSENVSDRDFCKNQKIFAKQFRNIYNVRSEIRFNDRMFKNGSFQVETIAELIHTLTQYTPGYKFGEVVEQSLFFSTCSMRKIMSNIYGMPDDAL